MKYVIIEKEIKFLAPEKTKHTFEGELKSIRIHSIARNPISTYLYQRGNDYWKNFKNEIDREEMRNA